MADDPNDSYAVDIWEGVDDANQENLTRSPSEWLTKISNDMRLAFAEFSKLGITPSALFSGNISLRSLLSNAFGLASGAARDAALADARDKFGPAVTDEGLVFDEVTGDAAFAVENGSLELSSVPNINATPDAISAAEAGAVLETFKIATPIMLALKNGSVENFASSATNLFMLGNRINAINEAKENLELDLIDNPDLDTSLGSSFVSTTSTQNVTFPSPNGDAITKALTTPKQIEKIRKAGGKVPNISTEGFSSRPTNFTEIFTSPSNSITLKRSPSVIISVTGRGEGTVAGETVILEFPLFPSGLQSENIFIKKSDTYITSGKTVTITQNIKKYDTIIIRYRLHDNYNPNIKTA
tara:strand:- start:33 stop:1100 length:1068 start_codon:yes stop_codon:yes gene_type:complete